MISNTYANKILDLLCGVRDNLSLPNKLYLGLSSSEPNTSTGTVGGEPTAASYERIIVGGNDIDTSLKAFGTAAGGVIENKIEIQFKTARESWGTMNYFFLTDSATNTSAILWGQITGGVTVAAETVPTFFEGELRISLDMPLT